MVEHSMVRPPEGTGQWPASTYRDRRKRLAEQLERQKLDAYFFSGPSDLYYLTGFKSDGFYGLFGAKGSWLFSSALLASQVRAHTDGCHHIVGQRLSVALADIQKAKKLTRVGFDPDGVLFRLGDALRKRGLTPAENPLVPLRAVKDAEELACITRACHITAISIPQVAKRLRVGMTERQVSDWLEAFFRRNGAPGVAFDLIAAFGPNTAHPHHVPGAAKLAKNQPIILDIGCRIGEYRSDLTRTLFFGKINKLFQRVFNIVKQAQDAGRSQVFAGSTGGRVDAAARGVIARAGYARYFTHSTGHGVGVDIHEPPWIRAESPDRLLPGHVLTVEPGIYLPGRFGVRIEDTYLVTSQGSKVLTI